MVVAALTISAFAGFRFAFHRYGRSLTDTIASYEFLNASERFSTLRALRVGDTNAVFDDLEGQIDTSVIALRAILDDYPTVENGRNYTNLLRRIADYRATFPNHDNITNMDATVTEILTQIKRER